MFALCLMHYMFHVLSIVIGFFFIESICDDEDVIAENIKVVAFQCCRTAFITVLLHCCCISFFISK